MKHLDTCPAKTDSEAECACEVDGVAAICVDCRAKYSREQIRNVSACPACGSQGVPMSPTDDVQVKINWHELRILGMWAENWAAAHKDSSPRMEQTISAITTALEEQFPSYAPLTPCAGTGSSGTGIRH